MPSLFNVAAMRSKAMPAVGMEPYWKSSLCGATGQHGTQFGNSGVNAGLLELVAVDGGGDDFSGELRSWYVSLRAGNRLKTTAPRLPARQSAS
jgi:hypothetical protein